MYETLEVWQQWIYWAVMCLAVLQLVAAPFVHGNQKYPGTSIFVQMGQAAMMIAVLLWLK